MTQRKTKNKEEAALSEPSKSQKQKLTLGVSSEVIDRAKAAGINISEITEQLLTTMTFDAKGNTQQDVLTAYQTFFDAIKGLLTKYGTSVQVGKVKYLDPIGENEETWEFHLGKNGIWKERIVDDPVDDSGYAEVAIDEALGHMHDPKVILENLIDALTYAAQHNKLKLAKLDFARRLVRTLAEDEDTREKK